MKRSILIAAVIAAAASGAAFAEDVWVKSAVVTVRAGKGPIYDGVVDVKKGDKLTVLERDKAWIKVSANGKEGWIHEKSLSSTQVNADNNIFKGMGQTASVDSSAAGRGLRDDAIKYAQGHNLSDAWMKWLEDFRDGLRKNPREWEAFMAEGHVGSAAQ